MVDSDGDLVNREEYYPFGDSSFGAFAKKRYRYNGKEKDNESGLYNYGMRYYAPWMCRFVSVDPLAPKYPHYTPYQYAGNKPINKVDIDGLEENGAETGPNVSSGDKAPSAPQNGDVFITGVNHQFSGPAGHMMSGTDGTGPSVFISTPLKTFMYGYAKSDNMEQGSWVTLGFETESGDIYMWNSEKKNFTSNQTGAEFDEHFSFDRLRNIHDMVSPIVGMATAWEKQGDPFIDIKAAVAAHEGGLLSFAWDTAKAGVFGMASDLAAGGQRRSDALWSVTLGGSAPGFGAGMSLSSRFRRFYSVLGDADFKRLKNGGTPWPTDSNKSYLGQGFYAWGNLGDAESYLNVGIRNFDTSFGTKVRFMDVGIGDFKRFKTLDLTKCPS